MSEKKYEFKTYTEEEKAEVDRIAKEVCEEILREEKIKTIANMFKSKNPFVLFYRGINKSGEEETGIIKASNGFMMYSKYIKYVSKFHLLSYKMTDGKSNAGNNCDNSGSYLAEIMDEIFKKF